MISQEKDYTIMIVDDDPLMRYIMRMIIEESGYIVVAEAGNGVEAVVKYSEVRPHIILMDVCMPSKNGIDATKDIVSFDKNAKVVICSTLGRQELVKVAQDVGALDVISKPFEIGHLKNVIHRVMQL